MKRMRYYLATLVLVLSTSQVFAYRLQNREQALFLTDKMAYELGLSPRQYADVFEINYDFITASEQLRYSAAQVSDYAIDRYYHLLNYRNENLYWVLTSSQYRKFSKRNYFYRPFYLNRGQWSLGVFVQYSNHKHYYRRPPVNYHSYSGRDHRRPPHKYYYRDRYNRHSSPAYKPLYANSRDKKRNTNRQRTTAVRTANSRGVSRENLSNRRTYERSVSRRQQMPRSRVESSTRSTNKGPELRMQNVNRERSIRNRSSLD